MPKIQAVKKQIIPRNQFADMIAATSRVNFVSIVYRGKPDMYRTDNPFRDAVVVVRKVGSINGSYQKRVQNKIAKVKGIKVSSGKKGLKQLAALFLAQPRKWGVRRINNGKPTSIVDHNGHSYLSFFLESEGERTYYLHGQIIPEMLIKPYLKPKRVTKSQGLTESDSILYEDIKLDNIQYVKMNHTIYDLI